MSEEKTITIKQDKYFKLEVSDEDIKGSSPIETFIIHNVKKQKDEEQNSYIGLLKKLPHKHPFFLTYSEIVDYIDKLQQENSQLKMRIEKAIEYYEIIDNRNTYVEISELRHLINLLKGDKE